MRIRNDIEGTVIVGDLITGFHYLTAGDLVPEGVKVWPGLLAEAEPFGWLFPTAPEPEDPVPVVLPAPQPKAAPTKPEPVAAGEPTPDADIEPAADVAGGKTSAAVPGKPGRRRKAEVSVA